jgi:hypothetical protein
MNQLDVVGVVMEPGVQAVPERLKLRAGNALVLGDLADAPGTTCYVPLGLAIHGQDARWYSSTSR